MDVSFLNNHLAITSSQDSLFDYVRLYADGSRICLCNRPEWLTHFYAHDFHQVGVFEGSFDIYREGYVLLQTVSHPEILQNAKMYFNLDYCIIIIKPSKTFCEFYHFASTPDNPSIVNFFLNNLDLLDRFILYFKDKAAGIIESARESPLIFPLRDESTIATDLKTTLGNKENDLRQRFVRETDIRKYRLMIDGYETIFTKSEMDCLLRIKAGENSREIAEHICRSQKTVENHIYNVKNRLNCSSKSQLIKTIFNCDYTFSNKR